MNHRKIAALIVNLVWAFALAVTTFPAHATVPQTLNYQGQLANAAGVPVNSGQAGIGMTFKLYDAATAGNLLWTEAQTVVVRNGLYSVTLGGNPTALTPALFGVPLYLGIAVGADAEMTPRIAMSSSATALRAAVADRIDGSNIQTAANTSNTLLGVGAGNATMRGSWNTASGNNALFSNTMGAYNTASGASALYSNTTGSWNTASGAGALYANTTGTWNTASGNLALFSNTTGSWNTASGMDALYANTTGNSNTSSGNLALFSNTTGSENTSSGFSALYFNTTGANNIAIGRSAGYNLTTGNYNIDIGNAGVAAEANTIRIGDVNQTRTFIAGIRGITTGVGDAIPVMIDSSGQLGTVSSSRRFKDDIADMSDASSLLMKLRPVTFTYKADKGSERALQYGLIAEEVAAIAPGLVAHSADGQIETVFYQFLTPMLLNEYQKQQRTIEMQTAALEAQKVALTRQTARIAELEAVRSLQEARLTKMESRVQLLVTQALAEKKVASR